MFTKLLTVLVIYIGLHGIQARLSSDMLNRIAPNMGSIQQHSDLSSRDATDICDRYDVDGCSVPGGLPYFDKVTFTPSCYRHDICYHCGVAYTNHTKTVCDNLFYTNMLDACSNSYMSEVSLPLKRDVQLHKDQIMNVIREHHSEFESVVDRHFNMAIIGMFSNIDDFWRHAQVSREDIITEWGLILRKHLSKKYRTRNVQPALLIQTLIEDEIDLLLSLGAPQDDITNLGEPLFLCNLHAKEYWTAVHLFGKSSYHTTPEFYCDETFVPTCLELLH